jgi:PhnB protein
VDIAIKEDPMAQVKAVPDGYSTVTAFLSIKGAAEAIEFYKKAFGAEERARMATPSGDIMHAEIKVGNSIVMISDVMMGAPTQAGLHLYVEDVDAWWKRATAAGAQIAMPLADMFWGDRYGVLTDRWGNRWSIATHKEDVPLAEMQKRAAEAMKNMK